MSIQAATSSKAKGRRTLPPFPQELELAETFGDWYDLCATNLRVVQRRDSSVRRMLAGLLFMLACIVGASFVTTPVLVLLGFGDGSVRFQAVPLFVGTVVLLGTFFIWFRYRRDWARITRLRRAWTFALRSPSALLLPVRDGDSGVIDPEKMHAYRAREHSELGIYFGVRTQDGPSGLADFGRALLYPFVVAVGALLVAVGLDQDDASGAAVALAPGVALSCIGLSACVRAWRRLADGFAEGGMAHDDRARWTGWRVVQGIQEMPQRLPWWRRLNFVFLPVALGPLVLVGGQVASGETAGMGALAIGIGVLVLPIASVWSSFLVRILIGRRSMSGVEVSLRVLPDDVPALGPSLVEPGPAVVSFEGIPTLRAVDMDSFVLTGATLISGERHILASRRHWLLLEDGSQVALACADVTRLQKLAERAGLRVVR